MQPCAAQCDNGAAVLLNMEGGQEVVCLEH